MYLLPTKKPVSFLRKGKRQRHRKEEEQGVGKKRGGEFEVDRFIIAKPNLVFTLRFGSQFIFVSFKIKIAHFLQVVIFIPSAFRIRYFFMLSEAFYDSSLDASRTE